MMVAPNSPRLRANARVTPVSTPGAIKGRVMVPNTQNGPAPRVRAVASSPRSTASRDSRMARTISGKPITAAATAAPFQVKATVTPNQSASKAPTGPRRPSSSSSR